MCLFVSFLSDFGLLPTLAACVIQNGRTPLLLLQLLLLMLPDGETVVLWHITKLFYLCLSLLLQAIAMCFMSETIFDQYSMLFMFMMFNFIDNSI